MTPGSGYATARLLVKRGGQRNSIAARHVSVRNIVDRLDKRGECRVGSALLCCSDMHAISVTRKACALRAVWSRAPRGRPPFRNTRSDARVVSTRDRRIAGPFVIFRSRTAHQASSSIPVCVRTRAVQLARIALGEPFSRAPAAGVPMRLPARGTASQPRRGRREQLLVSDTSDLQQRLGVRIRRRRAALGLTQCVLGSRVGVSRATIANVEAGRQNLTLRRLEGLARALETGLDELFRPGPDAR